MTCSGPFDRSVPCGFGAVGLSFDEMDMPSLISSDESEAYFYADNTDDVKSIRRDCRTVEHWQSAVLRGLQLSGWTAGMLLFLPAPLPLHWVLLIQHESSFRLIDEITVKASVAYRICGSDRRLWVALACKTLTARGWTPTMLARAWEIPKTNVYRFLEAEITVPEV